jgi:hypothetical protein
MKVMIENNHPPSGQLRLHSFIPTTKQSKFGVGIYFSKNFIALILYKSDIPVLTP